MIEIPLACPFSCSCLAKYISVKISIFVSMLVSSKHSQTLLFSLIQVTEKSIITLISNSVIFFFTMLLNSLAPGRSECDSENIIFNLVFLIGIFISSHDNALWWMPQDLTDDKSTLAQVMAWCRQAPSHYLKQCWLSSLSPYAVARPQWVNPCITLLSSNWFHEHCLSGLGFVYSDNQPIYQARLILCHHRFPLWFCYTLGMLKERISSWIQWFGFSRIP